MEGQTNLSVMNAVIRGKVTLADITKYTKTPKTTVLSSLRRLIKNSMIEESGDEGNRIYSTAAYRILSTDIPDRSDMGWLYKWDNPEVSDFYRRLFIHFIVVAAMGGISMKPVATELGRRLGEKFYEKNKDKSPEDLFDVLSGFLRDSQLADVKLISVLPTPEFSVNMLFHVTERTGSTFMSMISSFIIRAMSLSVGTYYDISEMTSECTGRYRLILALPDKNDKSLFGNNPIGKVFSEKDNPSEDFDIYINSKGCCQVSKDKWSQILEYLEGNESNLSSISKGCSISVSTVSTILEKMIETGLIRRNGEKNNFTYTLVSRKAMNWGKTKPELASDIEKVLDDIVNYEGSIYKNLCSYVILDSELIGMDLYGAFTRMAIIMAKSLAKDMEGKSIEDILIHTKATHGWDRNVSFHSLLRFTASITLHERLHPEILRLISVFDAEFYRNLLVNVTRMPYAVVKNETFDDGTDAGHMFELVQKQ